MLKLRSLEDGCGAETQIFKDGVPAVVLMSPGGNLEVGSASIGEKPTGINCYLGMNCCCQVESVARVRGMLGELRFWLSNFSLPSGTLHLHPNLTLSRVSVFFPGLIPNVASSIYKPLLNTYHALGPRVWVPEIDIIIVPTFIGAFTCLTLL